VRHPNGRNRSGGQHDRGEPSAAGNLVVFPSGAPLPVARTVSFRAGRTQASSTVVSLDVAGEIDVWSSSATHLVVDVTGYFR